MERYGGPRRLLVITYPARNHRLRVCRQLPLSAGFMVAIVALAFAIGAKAAIAQSRPADTGYLVEAGTCASCHGELVKRYASNPHAQAAIMPDGKAVTCASCHGSGKAHVADGGDTAKIIDLSAVSAKQVDSICLSCHEGKRGAFSDSAHGKGRMSCLSCHRVHAANASKYMLTMAQSQLCFQCHDDTRVEFSMRFRHKVQEGLVECSDCHDPHDVPGDKPLAMTAQQNTACTNCHTRMAGPFLYEHPVMRAEGCTACHVPHGGQNPHLLVRADVNALCEICHMPLMNSVTGAHVPSMQDHATRAQSCISCHVDMHGSNVSPAFLRKKEAN